MRWWRSRNKIQPVNGVDDLKKTKSSQKTEDQISVDSDEEEEKSKVIYKPSGIVRIVNYLLCRSDLANRNLSVEPVTLVGLFRFAEGTDKILLLIGILLACISGAAQPALGIITGQITNTLLVYNTSSTEFYTTAMLDVWLFGGIGLVVLAINFVQYMCFQFACIRITSRMKQLFVRSILRQNAGWFDTNHSGELTTKLNDNMERVFEGIGDKLGVLIRGIVMFVTGIIISMFYQWRLALMMMGLGPICCICMSLMARSMSTFTSKELNGVGRAGNIAEESLMGVRTVQSLNGQEEMVERYTTELGKGKSYAIRKEFWGGIFGGIFLLLLLVYLGGATYYGGQLYQWGIVQNPGDVFVVVNSMLLGAYFLGRISPQLMVLLNARVAAASIYEIIDRTPDIDAYSSEGETIQNVTGKVVFENVHFRYATRKKAKVLKGLNLTIEPGTCVALVGHSGCGKSTTVGLLTRLYEAEHGRVMVDGKDVRGLNIDWLRRTVGIVQQEPALFNETIHNNLLVGNPASTREDMIRVAKMANAHEFISKMPNGYETIIGDGGVQLSGGQKQRIAIARVLLRDPKILLLDEATSALDAQSESVVQSALNNAAKGRTTIMIAHRLSTIREADKIVFFDNGVIVESGTHDELVAMGGAYAKLVRAQQFKEAELGNEEKTVNPTKPRPSRRISFHRSFESLTSAEVGLGIASRFNSLTRPSLTTDIENENFAEEVQKVMEEDGVISSGYLDILKNAQGNYGFLTIGTFFAILRGSELAILAVLAGYEFEAFQKPQDGIMKALGIVFLLYGCLGVFVFVTQIISGVLYTLVSENLGLKFRVQAFRNLLYQDASFFDNPAHAPGKLITRLASDAPNVKAVMDGRMLQVVYSATSTMICLIIGYTCCWQIAIAGSALLTAFFVVTLSLAYRIAKENLKQVKEDEAGKIAIEIIENVKTIQLLTSTQRFLNHFTDAQHLGHKRELKKAFIQSINMAIAQTYMYFAMFVCYAVGVPLMYHGVVQASDAFRAINAMMMGAVAVMHSSHSFPEFVKAKTAAGMLFKLIYRRPQTGDVMEGISPEIRGNVSFDSVRFAYPQKPMHPVMTDLSVSADPGQTIALVGPSGTGKSTCVSMLERFYDVCGGKLKIDGEDIRHFSLHHLRSQMALVGQEPRLFAGSIKDNICLGLKDVPMEKVNQALELANATNFLANLPSGIETEVGEKGSQLSGGQKQRIAIARALVRDPKILLLDEATSALDSESEKAVQEALDRARQGRTCITIAHRLSSIQNSDLIVYIDRGKVRESGTHEELMRLRGHYYELIRKQDLAS